MQLRNGIVTCGIVWLLAATGLAADAKIPVVVDTDLGSGIDNTFALALMLASPEVDVQAITTCSGPAEDRAWIAGRLLTGIKREGIPVAYGRAPQPRGEVDWQIQYRRHAAVIFNRTQKPAQESAVEIVHRVLSESSEPVTLVANGPLTNFARLLTDHPGDKQKIARLFVTGDDKFAADTEAARQILSAGLPLTVLCLPPNQVPQLREAELGQLFDRYTRLTLQVQNLYQLWYQSEPPLTDAVTAALLVEPKFCTLQEAHLKIVDDGLTMAKGKPYAQVATTVDRDAFVKWYIDRVRNYGQPQLPQPPQQLSKLVSQSGLPARVHAFEDFETEIERRWWMSGMPETKNTPPGRGTAGRGVLTLDFDGRQGNTDTLYTGVVFNPVPGPPMGPNTRLSFRYFLKGTDRLRVQLYSLSNGYHRYLSLAGLPQKKWQWATVDMTQMRRPDGSGGPLAEDERVDDIQFYVGPQHELIIDDIVLYEPGPATETRPFPKNLMYTGWFDTGNQGREWPGDFEIVPHEKPRTWDAAKSVQNENLGRPWIRLSLRGERPAAADMKLRFRYRLTGGDRLEIAIGRSQKHAEVKAELTELKTGEWAEAEAAFPGNPAQELGGFVDEIKLIAPAGAELLIDDVLLYEPGLHSPESQE